MAITSAIGDAVNIRKYTNEAPDPICCDSRSMPPSAANKMPASTITANSVASEN
jgi:hypothetical protein